MQIVTNLIVETFAPEHGRTSCSDDDRCNGLASAYSAGRTAPRCNRCALLEILHDLNGEVPSDFELVTRMEIHFKPKGTNE